MPPKKKTSKKPKKKNPAPKEPVLSPQDHILEDCGMIACVADDIEVYINEEIEDENLKAYLLGRLTALQSNIDFLGHALANPNQAKEEMDQGDGPQAVNDIFEELFTRISNIEHGLVTVGIGTWCDDCGGYAPPVERVEEDDPSYFPSIIPPKKEEPN